MGAGLRSRSAVQTLTARNAEASAEDVGNIVSLEHVNTQVPDQSVATLFYIIGLGFTRDPYMNVGLTNMWINIGEQQFHLPTGTPQVVRGHTGLVVPDLAALKQRLESIQAHLSGTRFAWTDRGEYVEVSSPWGNRYRCYAPGADGGAQRGVPYVEFSVPVGSAAGIQRFYDQVFGAPSTLIAGSDGGSVARVQVGRDQTLIFRESDAVPEYDGHHIAIYIANFSGPFQYLAERNLVTEGIRNHQFRFQAIVDPLTDAPVYTLEHEVRSSRHPGFRRPLVNRD
jgi:hypothetical protein